MTNKTTNTPLFKVKCIITPSSGTLTEGVEYEVISIECLVDDNYYEIVNDNGDSRWYFASRFEIVDPFPKGKQEFSVGDKVVINKVSSSVVTNHDRNVKVGDIATVVRVGNNDIEVSNKKWKKDWWFYKTDVSLVADDNSLDGKSQDYPLLSHQEVVQAILDGKELEIQYADGTWNTVSPINTTLHQLTTLNFRLKLSLEDKRKAVIKKLLTTKVAVLCKCWDDDDIGETIVAITRIDDDYTYPYISHNGGYKNAFAVDDSGNEITDV